jgi:hypothetical protein
VTRHVKASFAAPIQANDRRRVGIGLVGFAMLGLMALLGIGAPSASAVDTCPNAVFRTGPGSALPDCRAYELVTPPYTGGHPLTYEGFLGELSGMFATDTVTPAGDSVVYHTLGGGLSGFSATGELDRYRARRTASGWRTEPISPGGDQMVGEGPGGISPDHEYSVFRAHEPTAKLWPGLAGHQLVDVLRTPGGYEPLAMGSLGFADAGLADWISAGGTHVIFTATQKLEPNAPSDNSEAVYDRTPGGPTHVVSLLPGKATATTSSNFLGATKDGTEVAFTPGGPNEHPGGSPFYVRRNNAVTEEVVHPGGAVVGKELVCSGGPGGAILEYQWLRDGDEIGGATSDTYTTTSADEGTVVQCRVTASNGEGTSLITSDTRLVEPYQGGHPPYTAGDAIVNGGIAIASVGMQLTCTSPGFFSSGSPTLAYQWLKDGNTIGGATSATYTPLEADAGSSLQCRVTASNADGTAVLYSYNPVSIYNPAPKASANPAISNATSPADQTPAVGDELSCSEGTWSAGPTFAFQWLRAGNAIPGATSPTYTVAVEDEGKALQCEITATNAAGATQALSKALIAEAGPSSPIKAHPLLETFGSAAQPAFGNAEGMAIDQSSGDVLVIDAGAGTLSRYNPDGTPADFSALATNVIDGMGTGDETPQNGLSFAPSNEVQIAVDNSGAATDGDIYVTQIGAHLIDVFASSGAYLGQLTQYEEGPNAEGPLSPLGETCGVAVAPNGALYVGDYNNGIHKYVPSADPPANTDNSANFSYPNPCTLAAGAGPSASFIFADTYGGELAKLDSSSGEVKYTLTSGVTTVSVDPSSGHVYAVTASKLKEFDASGASATLASRTAISNGQGAAIRGSSGNVYVSTGTSISVYGPAVAAAPEPPEQESAGGVFGTPTMGNTLFCAAGSWSGNPTFAYQWLRNGNAIGGATSSSYALTSADIDKVVQCRVTATNEDGAVVAVDANQGAKVITRSPPVASASLPPYQRLPTLIFDGIFNGRVFYSDGEAHAGAPYYSYFGNLYMRDLNTEKTSTIADSGDASIVEVSEDGSHVYFVSKSLIDGEGEAGKPNLGVWETATESAKFIATVAEADVSSSQDRNQVATLNDWALAISAHTDWDLGRAMNHTRSTPDGTVFAFESTAQLTSFDNTEASAVDCKEGEENGPPVPDQPCDEVYRYDAGSEELTCVSCGPGNGPATGNARLQTIDYTFGLGEVEPATPNAPVEVLTNDGDTLFFESTESLVPQDGNETNDVYRWKKGEGVALISTGQSSGESALYGVTPDGSDVIFATREKLLPQDENGSTVRFYDARVDGGFPPPEETVTEPCGGDACQGAASAGPEAPNVASSALSGEGNVATKLHCRSGSRKVVARGKARCVKRKAHHRHHRRSKAGSKRGASR